MHTFFDLQKLLYSWLSPIRISTIRTNSKSLSIWETEETLIIYFLLTESLCNSNKTFSPLEIELERVNCTSIRKQTKPKEETQHTGHSILMCLRNESTFTTNSSNNRFELTSSRSWIEYMSEFSTKCWRFCSCNSIRDSVAIRHVRRYSFITISCLRNTC